MEEMRHAALSLRGKGDGHMHVTALVGVLMLMIAAFSIYQTAYRKVTYTKYRMDNGIILSALAADVVDLYALGTYDEIAFETETAGMYKRDDAAAMENACKDALDKAYMRFVQAVTTNLPVSCQGGVFVPDAGSGIESVTLNRFVIYNVYGEDVYVCERNGTIEKKEGEKGTLVCDGTGDTVTNSAVYVSMEFKVYALGKYYYIPINEFVDITENY